MIVQDCEFGCECSYPVPRVPDKIFLDETDVERLVKEKVARARRYLDLMDRLSGQFESD